MELSVVVPTLNGRDQLAVCLDALAEHAPDAEVVVVNGPSADGTTGMVRDRDDVDVLVEIADRGLNVARNAGIDRATGDVVALLNHGLSVEEGWQDALASGIAEADVVSGPTHRELKTGLTTESVETRTIKGRTVTYFNGDNASFSREILDALDGFVEGDHGVPIVGLTEIDGRDVGERAVRRGAQDFLVKGSLDGDRLWRAIRYAVERQAQVEELEQQARELRRQNDRMAFFNAVLRHDLLNGMNVIRGRAQLLRDSVDDEERDHVEALLEWSDSLVDLTEKVRAVLDSVTEGEERDRQPVDLAPVVAGEAERVRGMAEGVTVTVDVPAEATVLADDLLGDVIGNLMTNAVEHNDPDGLTVTASASVADDTVTLSIADDGAGLPATEHATLFERGESGTASNGSGFGLHFVDVMVDTYGGDVRAGESDAGGAEFVLTLPRADTAGQNI